MNKKGFTLIEILCVIIILAIVTVIVSINVFKSSDNTNTELYCSKIKMIESFASEYGIKYELELNNSNELYHGLKSLKIKVQDLVDSGKLKPDKESDVINPIDNSKINDLEIVLYLKNNQIYAEIPNNICEK